MILLCRMRAVKRYSDEHLLIFSPFENLLLK